MSGAGLPELVSSARSGSAVTPAAPTIDCSDIPLLGTVCDAVGDQLVETLTGIADTIFGPIIRAIGGAAGWLLDQVLAGVMSSTQVDVRAPWFTDTYDRMVLLAGGVALFGVLLSATSVVVYHDAARLRRTVTQLLTAGSVTGAAAALTALLLDWSDALTRWVLASGPGAEEGTRRLGSLLAAPSLITGATLPVIVLGLVLIVVLLSCLVLWLQLLMRAAAVYLCVLFLPLALASSTWEPARRWLSRLVRTLVTLVFTKFIIATTLSVGMAGLAEGDSVTSVLGAAALLSFAAYLPWGLYKLVGVADEGSAHNAFEGAASRSFWHAVTVSTSLMHLKAMQQMRSTGGAGRRTGGGSGLLGPPRASDRRPGPPVAPTRPGGS